jgi:alpha-tubulin suppressor-like RCC1 family protein
MTKSRAWGSCLIFGFILLLWPPGSTHVASALGRVSVATASQALIANGGAIFSNANSLVDSYQSSLGAYGQGNTGDHAALQAATTVVQNGGVIRGPVIQGAPARLSVVQPPPSARSLGALVINSGASVTLPAGTYVASSLTLNGNSSLRASGGAVQIWVTGALTIGGRINSNGVPGNVQFFVTGLDDVNVNGGSQTFATIYAPAARVNVDAAVFGYIVADILTLNSGGALHFDLNSPCVPCTTAPTPLPAIAIAAGGIAPSPSESPGDRRSGGTACVLLVDGRIKCWGDNELGQLGIGTASGPQTCVVQHVGSPCSTVPVDVEGLSGIATGVTVGTGFACALLVDGSIQCWGSNAHGELGDGLSGDSFVPQTVVGLRTAATAVSAGTGHACALLTDGTIECWGSNSSGQLGDGTNTDSASPVPVVGLHGGPRSVAAGDQYTCAVLNTGGIDCWGNNSDGELGDASPFVSSSTPVAVEGLPKIADGFGGVAVGVSVAGNSRDVIGRGPPIHQVQTCALLIGGEIDCWGAGYFNGGGQTTQTAPVAIHGLNGKGLNGRAVATGASDNCALSSDGQSVACWGANDDGADGDSGPIPVPSPTAVFGLSGPVIALAAGNAFECALLSSGGVECWGDNTTGSIGDGVLGGPTLCLLTFPCALGAVPVQFL